MMDQMFFSPQDPRLHEVSLDHSLLRYHRYRNHRLFDAGSISELAKMELRSLLRNEDVFGRAYVQDGIILGACFCRPLPWDSLHFNLSMASLITFFSSVISQKQALELVHATLGDAEKAGFEHLSAHVDSDDYVSFNSLVASGFRLMDAKRTFVSRHRDAVDIDSPKLYEPREYRASDRDEVLSLIEGVEFKSRFTRDPIISGDRARFLYVKWMEHLLDADIGRRLIYVVEKKGRGILAASGGFALKVKVGGQEKTILADGIFASKSEVSGSYLGMMKKFILESREKGYALVETAVSLNNRAVNRALTYIGGDAVTCHYALHLSLRK